MSGAPTYDRMLAGLFRAIVAAGESPDDLRVYPCEIDRTWGDSVGYVITGRLQDRAAAWCAAWIQKHLAPRSSYDFQVTGRVEGVRTVYVQPQLLPAEMRCADVPGASVPVTGTCVAEAYYPCAE